MTDENQEDVGKDVIRFHRIITRSLEVSVKKVNLYLERRAMDESQREGFINYIQIFSTVLNAHHLLENEKIFPYFKDKLPDAPYDLLIEQHKEVEESLSHIKGGINSLKSNEDELKLLNKLKNDLWKIDKIWHPHIRIEEKHIYRRVESLNLSPEETNGLRGEYSQFLGEHATPPFLVVPFVLYNLSPEDRTIMAHGFPEMVTKKLVPIDWKDEWASMQPFLLK